MSLRTYFASLCIFIAASFVLSGCQPTSRQEAMPSTPNLIIYSCLEKSVSEPIIKEFEERTGYLVQTEYGSSSQLRALLGDKEQTLDWDLVFGAGTDTLEQTKSHWQPYESPDASLISASFQCPDHSWTTFSTLPLVIIYNTNVVTYRELPTGWSSLLEPRWKGRVAFGDPASSDVYASALATAVHTCQDKPNYLESFLDNINYSPLASISEVNSAVADGRYSLGVTLEGAAQTLSFSGTDIDYIYPEEGTTALPDGTAIIKDCAHMEAAQKFVDFTISQDVQYLLITQLNRRSVRTDISPAKGLSSIHNLPLITYDLLELNPEKESVVSKWNTILHTEERRYSR